MTIRHPAAIVLGLLAIPVSMESVALAEPPPPAPAAQPPAAAASAPAPAPAANEQKSSESAGPVVTLTGLGVGVVGVVVGSIFGARSLSQTSDLKDACPGNVCPPQLQSDLDAAKKSASLSDAGFFVGAIGFAVAIAGIVLWHDEAKSDSGARARAVVGPGTVALQGQF